MAQKPIAMEHLKQILQLNKDGVGIREISSRVGISGNSVRKYLSRLKNETASNVGLARQAYENDMLELDANRLHDLAEHLLYASKELSKTGVKRQLLHLEYWPLILMAIAIAATVIICTSILKAGIFPCTCSMNRRIQS